MTFRPSILGAALVLTATLAAAQTLGQHEHFTANAVSISAGPDFACAALMDGTVMCWGNNTMGQLGNGTMTSASMPTISSCRTRVSTPFRWSTPATVRSDS